MHAKPSGVVAVNPVFDNAEAYALLLEELLSTFGQQMHLELDDDLVQQLVGVMAILLMLLIEASPIAPINLVLSGARKPYALVHASCVEFIDYVEHSEMSPA